MEDATPFIILVILIAVILGCYMVITGHKSEGFDAAGLIFNKPPEWFNKYAYNVDDWFVGYYPDQTSQPGGCDMHYRGDPETLNFMSSAYRFWRM